MPDSSPQQLPESDEALAARAARGDQAAFVALYDRHFHDIYDFLARLLLSRRRAATALLSTFVRFRRRLSEEHGRGSPRLAILATAYQAAIEEGPSTAEIAGGDEEEQLRTFAQVDPDRLASPGEAAQAQEEALIVWQGAAGVDRTEYALLDLHLRRGLNAAQAGQVLGMGRFKVGGMISRLKTAAEEAFTSLLVFRFGRQQCTELDQLAASMDEAALPSESRHLVSGHIAACANCSETRKRLVPPLNVLAALLPVPPVPGVKDAVLQDLLSYTAVQAGAAVAAAAAREAAPPRPAPMGPPPQRPGIPPAIGGSTGGPVFPLIIGAAVALAIPVAALLLWLAVLSGDGGDGSASVEPTSTPLGGAALEGCGSAGPGTPGLGTCTPTPTRTATLTPTATAATKTPSPTGTASPSPSATAPPVATATKTPVVGETPTGTVETATPTPKPSPGPGATATAASSPSPAHSPSPGASPSPH